jgi:dipeptidyl aminopeptidase/acylaminoacyl peptidase
LVAAAVFLTAPAPARAGETTQRKPVSIEHLYLLEGPRDARLAPPGAPVTAAYVRGWIDPDTKQERQSLWVIEDGKPRALEASEPDARTPTFSPDGKWIVFLSTRPRPIGWKQTPPAPPYSDAATDIWLIPAAGGETIPLAGPGKPYGRVFNDGFYGRLAFSPDGKKLAFVADDGGDPRTRVELASRVEILRADQGEGYTGYGPAQVWIAHLDSTPGECAAGKIQRLTKDDNWYGDPQWSPGGDTIVVHANKTKDRESVRYSINHNFDLWAIDTATGKQTQLTTAPGPEVSPRFAPDGKRLACLSVPRRGSHRDTLNLAVVTLSEKEPRLHVVFDHHAAKVESPHPSPAFPLPEDCWRSGDAVLVSAETGVKTQRLLINLATGKGTAAPPPGAMAGLPSGNRFLGKHLIAPSKVISWKSDEFTIEGILTTPPPEVAMPPYKVVLYPHGGPHSRTALGFDFTVQVLAAHGYAVLQPNFRGSSGYGQKFIEADRFDFGGGDMRDCLAGLDHLIAEGVADAKRQFVYGSSYGGFMTTWLVGQTPRFRAAVAQNAVTDLTMMWALSDLQSWTEWEFGGLPWEAPDKYRRHSPLSHVGNVMTPTLILHSRDDRRVPLPMGKAFHQALLKRSVPTEMVIYPDEGHGIRQPRHREDVLRRLVGWFERHGMPPEGCGGARRGAERLEWACPKKVYPHAP